MTAPAVERFDTKAAESALEVLALAYIEETRKPRAAKPGANPFMVYSWVELGKAPLKSRRAIYRERIIRKPIEGALRFAIRELGEHAFANGVDLDGMLAILDNVAERHPDCEGRILSAVDHAWDGIGCVDGHVGWCA
jgi:hypothetical protein